MGKDLKIKEIKLRRLMEDLELPGIILSSQTNFLWLTGGRRNDILKSEDVSLVYLFISRDERYLISTNSDKDRMLDEELAGMGFQPVIYDWYDQDLFHAIKKIGLKNIGGDFNHPQIRFIGDELVDIRRDLTHDEYERLKELAGHYSTLVTDFCMNLKPGLTEKQLSNNLTCMCLKEDIRMPVLMVGSDGRAFSYRHPAATDKKIDKYFILATVAEKYGLNISLSRCIHFGKAPEELNRKIDAVNIIDAAYSANSREGITLKELFKVGIRAYAETGFKDEWKRHTQGGILGYKPREFVIDSTSQVRISKNNALSWNPTIEGVKTEDVYFLKNEGLEQLTIDKNWPYTKIDIDGKSFLKPIIMEI